MITYCMLVSINASQTSLCDSKYNFTSVIFQPSEGQQDYLGASIDQICIPVCRFSYVPLDGGRPQVTLWGSLIEMGKYQPGGVGRREGKMLSCTSIFKLLESIPLKQEPEFNESPLGRCVLCF